MDSILVVEDEQLILDIVAEVLEMEGYRVAAFKNADAAWSFIESCGYPPRLLITDLQMPGLIDGVELVKRVHGTHPTTPVIVASGYHPLSKNLLDQQIFWLSKPYEIEQLCAICRKFAPHR
ncbi:response regulator [Pseudomonas marginalis]|uniref:response regulator n=1 Tax=Pseudomonas marginalis TaxID=298 RepID=UPI001F3EDFDB|nr:response regulator [Pseudomonas marginalis]MCF5669009.1 response regulator [Pseudomonas marginalis]